MDPEDFEDPDDSGLFGPSVTSCYFCFVAESEHKGQGAIESGASRTSRFLARQKRRQLLVQRAPAKVRACAASFRMPGRQVPTGGVLTGLHALHALQVSLRTPWPAARPRRR